MLKGSALPFFPAMETSDKPEPPSNKSEIQPVLHETPAEALTQVVYKTLVLEGKTFEICYPGNPDALLDHPATHAAFERDEYMPYWADLWPSAQVLSRALLQRDWEAWQNGSSQPLKALEIGCGVGLPGISALSLGFEVVFSDYDVAALDFVERNAIANGFKQFETLGLDWRVPPDFQVDLLLASDVIYEERNIEPLIRLMQVVLKPDGRCLLVDPNRPWQKLFRRVLKEAGLSFTATTMLYDREDNPPVDTTVFEISVPQEFPVKED